MTQENNSARALLDAAYENLELNRGELLDAASSAEELTTEQWVDKGEWLSLASEVKAEKVFFVKNNPVIVFAKSASNDDEAMRRTFNRVWCMARPMLLFLAREGELAVYNLTGPPVRTVAEWKQTTALDLANSIQEVQAKLKKYRREQVESGRIFEDEERFGRVNQRADQTLIQDLKTVRNELMAGGLSEKKLRYAHALIGRSIFIRYLEDRGVLTREYFAEVAGGNGEWQRLLDTPPRGHNIDPEIGKSLYLRVMASHGLTYALFDKLAHDFNGDMFPSDAKERATITQAHLNKLGEFLRGEAGRQQKLFFWAYKFNIIPVELISSIYEEFYHVQNGNDDHNATHYTPAALVDFVLSQILTPECLKKNPRILDPACGSGIFLVEAFRRIVRYHVSRRGGRRLTADQLRNILKEQIVGIEINEEAARVAAFSLYLALLHYQKPPDILKQIEQGRRLPKLLFQSGVSTDEFNFNNIIPADAARVESDSSITKNNKRLPFTKADVNIPSIGIVDIIVGNPPWGKTREGGEILKWCNLRGCHVGNKELSQAFILKSLDLVREGGHVGLLVSSGVLLKQHKKSHEFRQTWYQSSELVEVVNFAHVRDIFFYAGIAPFASVVFRKKVTRQNEQETSKQDVARPVRYWSAKKTAQVQRMKAVILHRTDLHLVEQEELERDYRLWKIFWWGNHRDRALINWIETNPALEQLCDEDGKSRLIRSRGFQENRNPKSQKKVKWLPKYKQLPTRQFQRYGPLDTSKLIDPPAKVERAGSEDLYHGMRLLVKRGITEAAASRGRIYARVESIPFCFMSSIHGFKLKEAEEWEYLTLLAIFWSSLARYYFFLTSSNWGLWHDAVLLDEVTNMPVRFPDNEALNAKLVDAVQQLREWNPVPYGFFNPEGKTPEQLEKEVDSLERKLDEAVFDLYGLSQMERDQVRDLCDVGLEFFYESFRSEASSPVDSTRPGRTRGLYSDLPTRRDRQAGLEGYLHAFLRIWNHELDEGEEFYWRVIRPAGEWPLLAVVFSTKHTDEPVPEASESEGQQWQGVMDKLKNDLLIQYNSDRIYVDGMVRAVTETDIIIIKRNERRLWTRSMAREDAEASLVKLMNLQLPGNEIDEKTASPHQRASGHMG
jgi:hypothetical protein